MKTSTPENFDNDITRCQHKHKWTKSIEHPNREFCYECISYRDIPIHSVAKRTSVTVRSKELGLPKKSSTISQKQSDKNIWTAPEIYSMMKAQEILNAIAWLDKEFVIKETYDKLLRKEQHLEMINADTEKEVNKLIQDNQELLTQPLLRNLQECRRQLEEKDKRIRKLLRDNKDNTEEGEGCR